MTLTQPHGLKWPVIMDATVRQIDGYRFIYYLPWTENRVLVEDTRYTTKKEINVQEWTREVESLIHAQDWNIQKIERVETGSLLIPFTSIPHHLSDSKVVDLSGIFHDVTGYSFPACLRVCHLMSGQGAVELSLFQNALASYIEKNKFSRSFYRLLNRLLFFAAAEEKRYKMLQHFYRLSESSIKRFYSGETSFFDMVKVFFGRPPVSVLKALKVMLEGEKQ